MKILLTGFMNTSAELLLKNVSNVLLLPNHKEKDRNLLIQRISKEKFDYIICFGQKPVIKNKVKIEEVAHNTNGLICTKMNCKLLMDLFENEGINAELSKNAGTSYCNSIYWNGLSYIEEHDLASDMVFIHVPYAKNISNFEEFQEKLYRVIDAIEAGMLSARNCVPVEHQCI